MGIGDFEQRLERLVEGTVARAFRSGVQPVEIGRRLTREMDLRRYAGIHGLIVPNVFDVFIASDDMERFSPFLTTLIHELEDVAREHARTEGYVFVGPVSVSIHDDQERTRGTVLVKSEVREAPGGWPGASLVLSSGERILVEEEPVLIGRLPSCDIVLADSNVSRRHAEVRREEGAIILKDLGSTNGTKVNGTRTVTRELMDGDEIMVGTTTLRFERA